MRILIIDVGGTMEGARDRPQETGKNSVQSKHDGSEVVAAVRAATVTWKYNTVSIGYPGSVVQCHPIMEPYHLGHGWLGLTSTRRLLGRSRSSMTRRCKRGAVSKATECLFLVSAPDLDPPDV